jgi:hypothetical protein
MVCQAEEMISGYHAATRTLLQPLPLVYVTDVEFAYAKIASSAVRVGGVLPVEA